MGRKIFILEGLPGVGKSTLVTLLRAKGVVCIDEVSPEYMRRAKRGNEVAQAVFIDNDEQKVDKALTSTAATIVMDRGPISTLAYNLAKHKLVKSDEFMPVVTWFAQSMQSFYERDEVHVIYLQGNTKLPYDDPADPYGTEANQKLLESISLQLARIFAKNMTVRQYDYTNVTDQENLINEILT